MFSCAATKYKQNYGKVPVLIIDNASKIPKEELNQIQVWESSSLIDNANKNPSGKAKSGF